MRVFQMNDVREPNNPGIHKIGVFWVYTGAVLGVAHPLGLGEEYVAGLVDSPLEHVEIWDSAFHLRHGFCELNQVEYQCVPRGRVLHARNLGPLVYLDRSLMDRQTKRLIAAFFGFSGRAAVWRADPHYTTSQPELDSLFDEY
jgi:hypothetical protein